MIYFISITTTQDVLNNEEDKFAKQITKINFTEAQT